MAVLSNSSPPVVLSADHPFSILILRLNDAVAATSSNSSDDTDSTVVENESGNFPYSVVFRAAIINPISINSGGNNNQTSPVLPLVAPDNSSGISQPGTGFLYYHNRKYIILNRQRQKTTNYL